MRNVGHCFVVLASVAAVVGGCNKPDGGGAPSPSTVAKPSGSSSQAEIQWASVERKSIRSSVSTAGSFRARRSTRVGPQVSGRVLEVLVDVGDNVKQGQELVRLETSLFDIEVAQRKADVESAQVTQAEAQLNFSRMKNLWEKPDGQEPSIPKKLMDDATTRLQSATAKLGQATEALRWTQERLKETVVKAPYDAVVVRRLVDPGEPVTSTPITHLLELQETRSLELEFALSQELLSTVRVGTPIEFDVEGSAGARGQAVVDVVHPALDEATRTFRSRAIIDNRDSRYRPGMLARVYVVTKEEASALTVLRRCLREEAGGWLVYVSNDGHPKPCPVEVGIVTDDEAQILKGLAESDKVRVFEK